MIRSVLSLFLILSALQCFSQSKEIPSGIQVPAGSKLILHTYAKGVQIYHYVQDKKDSTRFAWELLEPKADLYSDAGYHRLIGRHYFDASKSPTWEETDGSKVNGLKVQQADAPDGLAIPWLLLKALKTEGQGILKNTAFIQRLYTKGGKAPAKGNFYKGQSIEVAYSAEYFFYQVN